MILLFTVSILMLFIWSQASLAINPTLIKSLSSNPKVHGLENLDVLMKAISNNHRKANGIPLILKLNGNVDENLLKRKGIIVKRRIPKLNVLIVEAPPEALEYLTSLPEINAVRIPRQIPLTLHESVPLIRADKLWNVQLNGMNLTGKGITVCVIDSGIDYTHPALSNCTTAYQPENDSVTVVPYTLNITPTATPLIQNHTIEIENFSAYSIHIKELHLGWDDYLYIYDENGTVVREYNWEDDVDVWTPPITGRNVTVGVVINDSDSSVYIDMVANGTMIPNISVCPRIVAGYDFVNDDPLPYDDVDHGTMVAGIIGANGTIKGVAPDVNFVIIKACYPFLWLGVCDEAAIINGIYYCVENATKYNISVISMSLGGGSFSTYCDDYSEEMTQAIRDALKNNITVVVAAGNDGYATNISHPACINGTIPVGATTKTDEIAYFSSRSPNFEYFVFAPGQDILTTTPTYHTTGYYGKGDGTSFATPHVSGVVALMYQFYRLLYSTLPTPQLIRRKLVETGVPIMDSATSHVYPRVDAYAAVMSLDTIPPTVSIIEPPKDIVTNNTNLTFFVKLTDNFALKNASAHLLFNGTRTELKNWNFEENINSTTINFTVEFTSDGTRIINVSACDYSSCTSSLRTVVVDTTPPAIHLNMSNGTTINTSTVVVSVKCTDLTPITSMEYCLDEYCTPLTCTNGNAQFVLNNLTDGNHQLVMRAEDFIGNSNTINITFRVKVPPYILVYINESESIIPTNNVSVFIEGSDNTEIKDMVLVVDNSTYEHILINASSVNLNYTFSLPDGGHNITVCVNDSVNLSSCSFLEVKVDGNPPVILLVSPQNTTYTNSTAIPLQFQVSDRPFNIINCNSTIERFNGSGWVVQHKFSLSSNETPINYSDTLTMGDGIFNLTISCVDPATHITSIKANFTIDTLPPSISISWKKGNLVEHTLYLNESELEFNLSVNDHGTGIKEVEIVKLAGNSTEAIINDTYHNLTTEKRYNLSLMVEQENTSLTVVVKDSIRSVNESFYIVTDTLPPQIVMLSVPSKVALNSDIERLATCEAEDNETGIFLVEIYGDTTTTGNKTLVCCAYDYALNRVCNETYYYVYAPKPKKSSSTTLTTSSTTTTIQIVEEEEEKEEVLILEDAVVIDISTKGSEKEIDLSNQSILPFIKKLRVKSEKGVELEIAPVQVQNESVIEAFVINASGSSEITSINLTLSLQELLEEGGDVIIVVNEKENHKELNVDADTHSTVGLEVVPPATITILKKKTTQLTYYGEEVQPVEEQSEIKTTQTRPDDEEQQPSNSILWLLMLVCFVSTLVLIKLWSRHLKEKQKKQIIRDMERINLLRAKMEELLSSKDIAEEDRKRLESLRNETEKLYKFMKKSLDK